MNIQFFSEDTDFRLSNQRKISTWILTIIESYNFKFIELNYIFCSDEYLLEKNKKYLKHDFYTDIITFDNSEKKNSIDSDIFISVDRVKDSAKKQNVSNHHELNRVMIHGILHLLGYKDETDSEKKLMREKEDVYLSSLKNNVPRGTLS